MNRAGVIPSPNIWNSPDVYELENRRFDPELQVEAAMTAVRDWSGADVLDIGCGTGFHLPRFAETARSVVGVEPHDPLVALARRRTRALATVSVRTGTAGDLPLPDASIDVAHARWAYFFGPGCEPGLAELQRVLRPGGAAFVIDNDATTSTFGGWFRRSLPGYDPALVEGFFRAQGFERTRVLTRWAVASFDELAALLGIEFAPALAERLLAEHRAVHRAGGGGPEVDYAVNVWWRRV